MIKAETKNKINEKLLIKILFLTSTYLFLKEDILHGVVELGIIHLFDDLKPSVILDVACIIFLFFGIIRNTSYYLKSTKIVVPRLGNLFFLTILYITTLRQNEFIVFKSSYFIDVLTYFDYLIGCFFLFLVKWKKMPLPTVTNTTLYSDDAKENYSENYSKLPVVSSLSYHIDSLYFRSSFAIGLIGKWGSGKSTAMLQLASKYRKEKKDSFEVLEFNTWQFESPKELQLSFLRALENAMCKVDPEIKSPFQRYLSSIIEIEAGYLSSFGKFIQNTFYTHSKEENLHEHLNKIIMNSGKRYLVLLDDLDRLTSDEILAVFKLIRTMANFGHVIFVCAFDINYVLSMLRQSKNITFEQKFLDKVFNLNLFLPISTAENIATILREKLINQNPIFESASSKSKEPLITDSKNEYSTLKESLETLITSICTRSQYEYLANGPIEKSASLADQLFREPRAIIRFANSFMFNLNNLSILEIDISDYFYIELIKSVLPLHWQHLAAQEKGVYFIEIKGNQALLSINWPFFEERFKDESIHLFKELCNLAYDRERNRKNVYRAIYFNQNHLIYFNQSLFGTFSMKAYLELWNNETDKIAKILQSKLVQEEIKNFIQIISVERTIDLLDSQTLKK
ncbi:MAG: P-loop NTPase fold protein [Flavobacteriales bacterium]|jgi:hypothetical protein